MKNKFKIGDLVMLNEHYRDHGRLAIITKLMSHEILGDGMSTTKEVFITFTDTYEETHTFTSSLEWLDESR